ncbi:hypothetical protein PIB30_054520 [Stylosanthes scabra]|uniref:DUF4283 domain-containing protein n=1 Tax=Stylosanthes scabra TaxID=79078 RepID=A0ABU6VJU5_9FABA|nr:hypothetical protein [Stylosanthes scabra]
MDTSHAHPIEGEVIFVEQVKQDGFVEDSMNFVAKIISDKELRFRTIKDALMGIWGQPKGVNISDVGVNKVLISFQDSSKGFQQWRGGPWNIKAHIVNMHQWIGRKLAMEVEHKKLGHAMKDCEYPTAMSLKDPSSPRYKPGLGVNRAKALSIYDEEDIQQILMQKSVPIKSESDEESEQIEVLEKASKGESGNRKYGDESERIREDDSI